MQVQHNLTVLMNTSRAPHGTCFGAGHHACTFHVHTQGCVLPKMGAQSCADGVQLPAQD